VTEPEIIGVFNPDDEDVSFKFDGKEYTLKADDLTPIPRAALGPMFTQLEGFGITPIPNGTSKKDMNELVKIAREQYVVGTRQWAEDLIVASHASNEPRVKAGLAPIESPDVVQARAWLKKHTKEKV
jgi:hypothetical protein